MKRFFLCIMAVLPVFMCLHSPVYATELTDAEKQVIEACTYGENTDLSEFNLTELELEELFYDLRYAGKLPWYVMDSYSYSYDEATGMIYELKPDYSSKADYNRELYEQRIAEVLDACVLEGMEDWQIALSIHDYLIANCIYDEKLELRTGYDLLLKGSTVCSGYTDLYQDLLNRVGIPCVSVISDPMEHTWNLVQIGGQWYHVDLTWDDPTPDHYGYVSHQNFLVDDETIRGGEKPHYDWETDITCTDTRFDDAFFRDVESAIIYQDSNTCYLMRNAESFDGVRMTTDNINELRAMQDEINAFPEGKEREQFMELLISMQPLPPGQMEDVSNAALYLASPMSRNTTGAILMVDGGASIKAH